MLKLLDCRLAQVIRVGCLFAVALLLVFTAYLRAQQSPVSPPSLDPVLVEHRFTSIETKTDQIFNEIRDLKAMEWVKLLALSGLIGEAGIRVVRSKRP